MCIVVLRPAFRTVIESLHAQPHFHATQRFAGQQRSFGNTSFGYPMMAFGSAITAPS